MTGRAKTETRRSISWLSALAIAVTFGVALVRGDVAGPGLAIPSAIALFFVVAFWSIRLFCMPAERALIEAEKKENGV